MINKICDSPIHKVFSLVLAFIILSCCVLPSFVKADDAEPSPSPSPIRPNPPIGYKDGDTFRDIMLAVLDSWGISFTKSDPDDNVSILEYSDQLMQEFYEDNQTSQELFWDLVKFGASETGDLILDFLGVNKIRQIANWLKDKFSLTNNSSVTLGDSSIVSVGGRPSYIVSSASDLIPVVSYNYGNVSYGNISVSVNNSYSNNPSYPLYVTSFIYNGVSSLAIYTPSFTQTLQIYYNNSSLYTSVNHVNNRAYFVQTGSRSFSLYGIDPIVLTDTPSFSRIFGDGTITYPSSNSLVINTTIINIPSQDLDPSDGLQIEIPGTNWGDSIYTILDLIERLIGLYDNTQLEIVSIVETLETLLANLQHSVTVENIPGAVILDYDEYDIPIENEWGLFDIFFNTGGDEITLLRPWQELRSIIYGFPAPVLSFFALVVLFIVAYGFIRMGRDSH